ALALAQDPQIILLDEPTTFLDIRYQLELLELLKDLNRNQGLTIVMVLHDMNLAARYSDRIAMMEKGALLCIGKTDEVITTTNIERAFSVKAKVLNGDKIDFLFIDGDHTYEGVRQDYEMYSPLVQKGGYIAFHDINDTERHRQRNVHVAEFWNELE
ncbi:MAG: class I SAM-dependent methyltransferase, partial [Pseudanabaena sp.]